MTLVTARGQAFHVSRFGQGPPVVMLHGLLTGSVATWYLTCAPRMAGQWAPLMIDMRGHGLSDRPPTGYGSASMAEDLFALTADLPPFPIVGHSFGCVVAARFAVDHPERVTAVALVEPPYGLGLGSPAGTDIVAMLGRGLKPRSAAKLIALVAETSILADVEADPGLTDEMLAALPARLLAVFGDRSPCRAGAEVIGRVRPDAQVALLPGDHDVHAQSTSQLTDLLLGFLAAPADTPEHVEPSPLQVGALTTA